MSSTKTDPRNSQHGEEEKRPRFGDYSPTISQAEADELQRIYDQSSPETTPSGIPDDPRSQSQVLTGNEIEDAEKQAGTADMGAVGTAEKQTADKHSIPFNPTDKFLPPQVALAKKLRRTFKKKRLIPGLVVALIIGLGIFFAGISQGPLQLIHLSETLQIPMFHQEENTKVRLFKLFTWVRTGEVGTTRLTIQGNLLFPHIKKQMVANGIDLEGTSVRGFLKSARIDTSKQGSLYRGDPNTARARIAADLGVSVDKVTVVNNFGSGGHIEIDASNFTEAQKQRLIAMAVNHTRYGGVYDTNSPDATRRGALYAKMTLAVTNRWFNIVYAEGQPSWFHPFEKIGRPIDAAVGNAVRGSSAVERLNARVDNLSDSQRAFIESTRTKLNTGAKVTGASVGLAGGICIVKDVASSIPELNRIKSIIPAMKRAVVMISVGSQIKSGKIPNPEDVGELVEGFEDKEGKTVHEAKALKALQNEEGGEEVSPEIKQAFSEDSTPKNVEDALDSVGADTICGGPGQIAQFVAGTALLVVPGASVAGRLIAAGASSIAVIAITNAVKDMLSKELFLGEPHKGPNGGNVDAYGAREFANSSARLSGGLPLSDAQSAKINDRWLTQNKAEFNSKSLAGRIFDTKDYRSLAGRIIDSGSTNPVKNINNVASSLLSPLSGLTPRVFAAEKVDYDWGFPQFGFSDADINSPLIEDPYANAEKVAELLDGKNGNKYIKDAEICFGVELTKSSGVWSVITKSDPNPASATYDQANCDRGQATAQASSDQENAVLSASTDDTEGSVLAASTDNQWLRVRGYVIDSKSMNSFACLELDDEQSCKDTGAEHGTAQRGNPGETSGSDAGSIVGLENISDVDIKKTNCTFGSAPGGCYQLPESKFWTFWGGKRYPSQWQGSKCMVQLIAATSKSWIKKYPKDKVKAGDINATGHASHLLGEDVDINTPSAADEGQPGYSTEKTIEYGKLWLSTGNVEFIGMNDQRAINALVQYAKDKGLDKAYPQRWSGHADHFHVRIHNPKSNGECSSKPIEGGS